MTKQKGDIAEQAVILQALERGYEVLKPIGDRMPYDIVFDVNGHLIKVQVKSAWKDTKGSSYVVDARRTKTNRREMVRDYYSKGDFDFLIAFIADYRIFYIIPFSVYESYASSIYLVADDRTSRLPRTWIYREAWHLIEERARQKETSGCTPVKLGEALAAQAGGNPEPSPSKDGKV